MSEVEFLVEEAPEGGYSARCLGHSIYTEVDTWEELKVAVQEAVVCHFEEIDRPRLIHLHYHREEVLTA